jgi:hypothetical protein
MTANAFLFGINDVSGVGVMVFVGIAVGVISGIIGMVEDGVFVIEEIVELPLVPTSDFADGLHDENKSRKTIRTALFIIVHLLILIELVI